MKTINLQNTPALKGVSSEPVSFESNGATLRGILYKPEGATGLLPGVIVTGAWTTVNSSSSLPAVVSSRRGGAVKGPR